MKRRFAHPPIPSSPLPKDAGTPSEEAYLTTRHARRLRRDASPPEGILWSMLRDRQVLGLKFRRQHPLGRYFADFYCEEIRLVVECDSSFHVGRGEHDARRDEWMREQRIDILRVSASSLALNPGGVRRRIEDVARRALEGNKLSLSETREAHEAKKKR